MKHGESSILNLADFLDTDVQLPLISIITPCYNAAPYLRPCIESILSQDYSNFEYIIIDGGSTDGTVDIIREYEDRLTYWISEKDRGQSHAINKGFSHARGEVINWLGADDELLPGALTHIGRQFAEDPDLDVLIGACEFTFADAPSNVVVPATQAGELQSLIENLSVANFIPQPSCFFRRRRLRRTPPVREDLHYVMDHELWIYFQKQGARFHGTNQLISRFASSADNKTSIGGMKIIRELAKIQRDYDESAIVPLSTAYALLRYRLDAWRRYQSHPLAYRLTAPYWRLVSFGLHYFYGRAPVELMARFWSNFPNRPIAKKEDHASTC